MAVPLAYDFDAPVWLKCAGLVDELSMMGYLGAVSNCGMEGLVCHLNSTFVASLNDEVSLRRPLLECIQPRFQIASY